jgi:methanogenic corrinoid protein MtbC1
MSRVDAMQDTARQLSLSIDSVSRALAEWTVARHEELDASLADRYGSGWRRSWVTSVESRIRYLSQAIAVRRPAIFAHTVAWTGTAFAARDVAAEDLSCSLACMRDVLTSELPDVVGRTAGEYVDAASAALDEPPRPNGHLETGQPLDELMLRYLEAVLDGRRLDAGNLVLAAADGGTSLVDIYEGVLKRAQVEIGQMWHRGEVSVADEHFATATTEHVMSMLRGRCADVPRRGRRVVATAIAGDLHAMGVRMVAEFFEMDGWDVIYLGANMPSPDIIGALADHEAHLLAVSATSYLNLRELGELIDTLRATPAFDGVPVIVGGGPFKLVPDLHEELGADATAPSAAEAVAVANGLVSGRS